jgi:cytochrome o ubiquinol oxidase subunit 1
VLGFAMVWYMWWLAALSFVAMLVVAIGHTFNYDRDYHIPAEAVIEVENERTRALAEAAR